MVHAVVVVMVVVVAAASLQMSTSSRFGQTLEHVRFDLASERRTQRDVEEKVETEVDHFDETNRVEIDGPEAVDEHGVVGAVLEKAAVVDEIPGDCARQLREQNAEREHD